MLRSSWEHYVPYWLAALAFLVMLPGLSNPFLLDDLSKIVQNSDLHSFWSFFDRLLRPYPDAMPVLQRNDPSRPLVFFVYTVLSHLGGANPALFHSFNALVHAGNTALAYLLARRLFREPVAALGAALFFALLPIQVATAGYAYALSDLLAAGFSLVSLLYFLRESTPAEEDRDTWISALAFAAALACKQSAIALPAVVGAWVIFAPPRLRKGFKRASWLLGVALLFLAWRAFHLGGIGDLEGRGNTWSPLEYLSIQPYVLWRYVQLALWPRGLAVDHYLTPDQVPTATRAIATGAWILAIGGVLGLLRRRSRETQITVGLGLVWYLTWLAPTSSFVPTVDLLAERRTYLANFGLCLVLGRMYSAGRGRRRLAGVHLLLMLGFSVAQLREYATTERAWQSVLALYPKSPRAITNLSAWYIGQERFEEARVLLERGLEFHPDDAFAWSNLGSLYQNERFAGRDTARATAAFQRAIALRPQLAEAHYNLGRLHHLAMRLPEAEKEYRLTLGYLPGYAPALNNLGVMALDRKDTAQAARLFQEALRSDPDYAPARENRARVSVSDTREVPIEQVPTEVVVKTYRDHLRAHPKDAAARQKFREFCTQRAVRCDEKP